MDPNIIAYSPLFDLPAASSIFRKAFALLEQIAEPNSEMYFDEEHCTCRPAVSVAQMISVIRSACRDDMQDAVDQAIDSLAV